MGSNFLFLLCQGAQSKLEKAVPRLQGCCWGHIRRAEVFGGIDIIILRTEIMHWRSSVARCRGLFLRCAFPVQRSLPERQAAGYLSAWPGIIDYVYLKPSGHSPNPIRTCSFVRNALMCAKNLELIQSLRRKSSCYSRLSNYSVPIPFRGLREVLCTKTIQGI